MRSLQAMPVIPSSPRRLWLLVGGVVIGVHLCVLMAYLYKPTPTLPQRQASARTMEVAIMRAPTPPAAVAPVTPPPAQKPPETKAPAEQKTLDKAHTVKASAVDPDGLKKAEQTQPKPEKPLQAASRTRPVEAAKPAPKPSEAAPRVQPPSQPAAVREQAAAPVNNAVSQGASSDWQNWESQALAQLEAQKRYPPAAINRGQEDVIYVRLSIRRDGEIVDYKIVRSRGITLLDNAVNVMVRRASPLPPLPDTIKSDPYTVTVPVNFFLSRR
ncbi:TonB family protein [Pseudomonas sp. NPDC012596]|uniref:TonB family protein n=1 Tax=Pseudomonas sp. NPDC012596 TaxID=3364419 RepID=UPI003693DA88